MVFYTVLVSTFFVLITLVQNDATERLISALVLGALVPIFGRILGWW